MAKKLTKERQVLPLLAIIEHNTSGLFQERCSDHKSKRSVGKKYGTWNDPISWVGNDQIDDEKKKGRF